VRVELRLKRDGLISRGLYLADRISQVELDKVFEKEVSVLRKCIVDRASELSYAEYGVLMRWMEGKLDRTEMHRNTFSKYRVAIRKKTGYDIGAPGPVSLFREADKVESRTLGVPDSYELVDVNDLVR
jgi:hypothetical protein